MGKIDGGHAEEEPTDCWTVHRAALPATGGVMRRANRVKVAGKPLENLERRSARWRDQGVVPAGIT